MFWKLLLLSLCCLPVSVWAQQLTRQQAVSRALAQLSAYSQAVGNVTLSELDVTIAQTATRPKWEIAPSLIYTSASPNSSNSPVASFVSANGILETTALLRLRGELDTAGVLGLEIERRQALLQAAAAGSQVARQNLVLLTERAYYQLALATARLLGARGALASAQEFERITRLLLQAGEVPGVDLERARLLVRDRLAEVENQQGQCTLARESLRALLGASANEVVETVALGEFACDESEFAHLSADQIARRPELAQLKAQLEATRREAELARSSLLPRLTYSLGVGADSSSLHPSGFYSGVGLQAQLALIIPLDDGGLADAQEKQAQLRAEQLETDRALALRQFQQEFQGALGLVKTALRRVALGRENLAQSESIMKVAVARYRAGEARILEVTDAQNAVVGQRLNWLQAQADYQLALAQLRYAVALTPEEKP